MEIKDCMKVGLIHFMTFPEVIKGYGPICETLKTIIDDDYFDAVEVTWIHEPEERKKAAAMLKESEKTVAYGAQPHLLTQKLSLNSFDKEERKKAIETVKDGVRMAAELGAQGIAVLSGKTPEPDRRNEAYDILEQALIELYQYAESEAGIPLIVETFDRQPFGRNKNCLVGPTGEAVALARRVKQTCPDFGLLLDLSHLPILGESAEYAVTTAKDVLSHIHIGNCVVKYPNHEAYGDCHPPFGIPEGENGIDELVEFLHILKAVGYLNPNEKNIISFEIMPLKNMSAEEVIANAKMTLDAAWGKIE